MSFTWKLDSLTHDIKINSQGKINLVLDDDEVRQRIKVTLYHYRGEYFLNYQGGVPWMQEILGSKNIEDVTPILYEVVQNVPGVLEIKDIDINVRNRQCGVDIFVVVSSETGNGLVTLQGLRIGE